MSLADGILVLHGISMSGASMLRSLGPLRERLTGELGFELLAPDAGHRMSADELGALGPWLKRRYEKQNLNVGDSFSDGRFWDAGAHHDWFQASTDAGTGEKTYAALERSLEAIGEAVRGRRVVGVFGFSQGAAMATIVAARAAAGDARFAELRWGIFVSGFKPVFDAPAPVRYPILGKLARLFIIGDKDPIFPGNLAYLGALAQAFAGGTDDRMLVLGMGHEVPSAAREVDRIAAFVAAH